jgi:hypothetical protein
MKLSTDLGVLVMNTNPMKSKFLLLSLLAAAGLIAADAPADAPAGTPPPPAKGEKGEKPEKPEGKKGAMPEVPGVSKEEMQKYQAARKAASETPEVKAAKDSKDKKAYYEALNAAIIKADPTLAEVVKKVDDYMKSKSKKPKGAKKPEGDAPAAAPAAALETK